MASTFPPAPHFSYPSFRDTMGTHGQRIELTDAGVAHYNALHNTSCLTRGMVMGSFRRVTDGVEVYSSGFHFMGVCPNQLFAAEELVRLTVRQADSDRLQDRPRAA